MSRQCRNGYFPGHDAASGQLPTDNAFIEAFDARLRTGCLNASWFLSLRLVGPDALRRSFSASGSRQKLLE